jgi:hypothetical protein
MPFCETCGEWKLGMGHYCAPEWDAWESGDDIEDRIIVRATSASDAAEKAAERYDEGTGEGPKERGIFVRPSYSEAETDADFFEVGYELEVVYSAKASTYVP